MKIADACSPALLLFHHKFIIASVLSEEVVSFKKDDGVLNFLLSSVVDCLPLLTLKAIKLRQ